MTVHLKKEEKDKFVPLDVITRAPASGSSSGVMSINRHHAKIQHPAQHVNVPQTNARLTRTPAPDLLLMQQFCNFVL